EKSWFEWFRRVRPRPAFERPAIVTWPKRSWRQPKSERWIFAEYPKICFSFSILLESEASSRLSTLRLGSVHPQNRVHNPFGMSLTRAHRPPLSLFVAVSNHADMIRFVLVQLRILIRETQCAPQRVYLIGFAREKQPARF